MMVNIPVVNGTYPVTAVGSPLKLASILSVVSVPVAVAVCALVQVAELIAPVASAFAPLAIVSEAGLDDQIGRVFGPCEVITCPVVPAEPFKPIAPLTISIAWA